MAQILLAEDDDSLRVFLRNALNRAGHVVTACADGLEAFSALEKVQFDLLVADIVMPGIDGIELAQRANTKAPEMKVLFITGFAAVVMHARRIGANRDAKILSKPFHLKELVGQIEKILAA